MKLIIENWVSEKGYSNNISQLFNESVICYRNGAYRASLIFSYIGFLTIIKETIVRSKFPTSFTEPEWNALITKINNDDLWEKEVYEALIRTNKPIFHIDEDLRLQIRYWKDRRNDCAHFKNNKIESHHTESFWSFIISNIPKMTVEGGINTLLKKFDEHFNDTKTPPGSDYNHLIREIENSVLNSELPDFFSMLSQCISYRSWGSTDIQDVYCKILDLTSPRIHESLIRYLKEDNRDLIFLGVHPEKITQLNYSHTDIRLMWKSRFNVIKTDYNPFNIFCGMLKNDMIPIEQIDEANRLLINCFSQSNFHKLPEKGDIETLKSKGFFDSLFENAIEERKLTDYKWVNDKCDLIIELIINVPLTEKTVVCICNMAISQFPSQWLVKAIVFIFNRCPDIKKEFHRIALAEGISIPKEFI